MCYVRITVGVWITLLKDWHGHCTSPAHAQSLQTCHTTRHMGYDYMSNTTTIVCTCALDHLPHSTVDVSVLVL